MSDSQKMNEITNGLVSDLPEGWVWCRMDEIAKFNPRHPLNVLPDNIEASFLPMPNLNEDSWKIKENQTRPLGEIRKGYTHFAEVDVLFAKITPCMENGKAAIVRNLVNRIGCGTTELHVIRPHGGIPQEFIYFYIHQESFRQEAEACMTGTAGQLRVPVDFVASASILIPPLKEQILIVNRIELLLERTRKAYESLDKIPLIMKRFRQAALKKAFSGELTAEWRAQQQYLEPAADLLKHIQEERERRQKQLKKKLKPETDLLDSSELPELPERWVWTRLEDLSLNPKQDIVDGPFGSDMKSSEYREEGIPLIRLQNIDRNRFISKNFKFISSDKAKELSRHSFSKGDIVITKLGDPLGEACIVPDEIEWGIIVADVVRITVAEQFVNKFFISYLLNSDIIIKQLVEKTKGTTRSRVNLSHIRELELPLPPLPEQLEIFRRIESLFKFADETEKNATEARKRVEIMTQSILARAFRGDLSADFREAVKNWKDLDEEARGRYVFVLPEEERERVLNADEFPMEAASRLLERIGEERGKIIK